MSVRSYVPRCTGLVEATEGVRTGSARERQGAQKPHVGQGRTGPGEGEEKAVTKERTFSLATGLNRGYRVEMPVRPNFKRRINLFHLEDSL